MNSFKAVIHKDGYIEVVDPGPEKQFVYISDILFLVNQVNSAIKQRNQIVEDRNNLIEEKNSLMLERNKLFQETKKLSAQRDQTIVEIDQIMECLKNVSDIIQDYDTNSLHHARTLNFHRMKFPILWHEIDSMIQIYRGTKYHDQ